MSFGFIAALFGRHGRTRWVPSGRQRVAERGARVVSTHRTWLAAAAVVPQTHALHVSRTGRMKLRGYRRLIAVAAHLALLLAVCAPVASRLLMPGNMAMNAQVMTTPGEPTATRNAAAMDTQGTAQHPDGKLPTDACAYCSLFAQLPYVVTFAATVATLPALPVPLFPTAQVKLGDQPALLAFRPRGPPADPALA